MSRGSLFQKVGPETRKLRGPKVTVFVRGMMKSPRAAERRVFVMIRNAYSSRAPYNMSRANIVSALQFPRMRDSSSSYLLDYYM